MTERVAGSAGGAAAVDEGMARAFIEDLGAMRACYERMADLAREQTEATGRDDPDALLDVARRKQALVEDVARLEERTTPFRRVWPAGRAALAPAVASQVDGALDSVSRVLRDLIALEEAGQKALAARRDRSADEIKKLEVGRKTIKAYGGGAGARKPEDNRFIDRKE